MMGAQTPHGHHLCPDSPAFTPSLHSHFLGLFTHACPLILVLTPPFGTPSCWLQSWEIPEKSQEISAVLSPLLPQRLGNPTSSLGHAD